MPAQPPFLTPTRTPMISLAAFAITYLMRSAAASVSRITCGLGLGWPIAFVLLASLGLASMWDDPTLSATYHMLSTARASSDIRLGSQGGSQTIATLASPTPATLETAFSTIVGSSCADGQFGVVSV